MVVAWKTVIGLSGCLLLSGIASTASTTPIIPSDPAALRYDQHLRPFLTEFCIDCHGQEKQRAEVDLERLDPGQWLGPNRELWDKVRAMLAAREMPPDNRPQPPETLRQAVVQALTSAIDKLDASSPPNPGAVTIRRLNRNEYRNTIRDLMGVEFDSYAHFPHDESGYGFDNIGDVLSLPPILLEKYLAAAEEIAGRVIVTEDPALKRVQRIASDRFSTPSDDASRLDDDVWGLYREAEIHTEHEFSESGDYLLRITAYGEQAGPELPKMGVRLDGQQIRVQEVTAIEGRPETFEVPVHVDDGKHRLAVAFLNNFNSDGDRNLFLSAFHVVGPLGVPAEAYPEPHRRVLPRRPSPGEELNYAGEVLRGLTFRAYRRPVNDEEVARLVSLVQMALRDGASFERGIQLALQAVLVSPHFLYRWELDPPQLPPGAARELNDFEVASRLSYFLWSSMPDEELFTIARKGELLRPGVLAAQARRMLRDPKAWALVRHFGEQWLQTRNLEQAEPDASIFPRWNDELAAAMERETELFLWTIINEDRPLQDLIDADFTFLNEPLARHYGIEGIAGSDFRRVNLPPESNRGGVLTLGSVLTVTSFPTRTAPVLRGKWILEQILGTPPPPPPPDVPQLEEGESATKAATLRQRLEIHRSKAECMSCHQKMDPLGFALENFDAIGAWRERDGPHPIDNKAELPDGRTFHGATGLKSILSTNPEFPRALASKLLTFALGRGLESHDRPALKGIIDNLARADYKFSSLVLAIVTSEPFLKRQPATTPHEHHASLDP
jgi:hypothetical protein